MTAAPSLPVRALAWRTSRPSQRIGSIFPYWFNHAEGLYTFSLEWSRDGLRTDGSGDANLDGLPSFFRRSYRLG